MSNSINRLASPCPPQEKRGALVVLVTSTVLFAVFFGVTAAVRWSSGSVAFRWNRTLS